MSGQQEKSLQPHDAKAAMDRFWSGANLAAITGGQWLIPPPQPNRPLAGVTIDSRSLKPGQVFLAIVGQRFDGHDFVKDAIAAGAGLVIVQAGRLDAAAVAELAAGRPRGARGLRAGEGPGDDAAGVLAVDSPIDALQTMACHYRDLLGQHDVKVIAVTGSNGKTTTRHLIHAALSGQRTGTQSPRSFNNHLGLPLTLLGASLTDDFVVAEIGTSSPGEIAALARIARPNVGVMTLIGKAHIERFGSAMAIVQEKAALLGAVENAGLVVIPAAERRLEPMLKTLDRSIQVVRVGPPDAGQSTDLTWDSLKPARLGEPIALTLPGGVTVRLPLLGRHNAINALAAVAVGRWFGLSDQQMAANLACATGVDMRMQVLRLGDPSRPIVVINDAYNANPDSMTAALSSFQQVLADDADPGRGGGKGGAAGMGGGAGGAGVVVLGDMLELGSFAPDEHRRIGSLVAGIPQIRLAVLVGRLSLFMAEALARQWPEDRMMVIPAWDDQVPARVAQRLRPRDLVLLKASRGMGLERIIPAIQQQAGGWK